MLDRVVRYLRTEDTTFRLKCFASPEPLPEVAYSPPWGGVLVRAQVVLAGGRAGLACVRAGESIELSALAHHLKTAVLEGTIDDLPAPFNGAPQPIPPLGGLLGLPVFVDERATEAAVVAFAAFSNSAFVEMLYDDFARLERPRVLAFATSGELPEHGEGEEPRRKVA